MKELLKAAIENLAILSVNLRDARVSMSEGFNSLNINAAPKKNQSFRNVVKIEFIEMIREDDANDKKQFYSFRYDVGARLISPEAPDESSDEDESILTIEACFEAIYIAKKELSEEELEAFGTNNVGYNVWPYWREYLQSTCTRLGVNPIRIPFYNTSKSDIRKE
ncbi:TPA: hypothetical protein LSH87_003745 [Citrobacter koseri]|uniref:hypothetical protein n=1 Tax=Citrobacter koseri TaxID=545 RepID=UPI0023B169D1|nr:hypothetical protein [Citrobacter koseri]HBL6925836.1 hypothetical protein [Citrobacter koseri]HBL6930739.1 hypothetical protein [Citrobacter koseri]